MKKIKIAYLLKMQSFTRRFLNLATKTSYPKRMFSTQSRIIELQKIIEKNNQKIQHKTKKLQKAELDNIKLPSEWGSICGAAVAATAGLHMMIAAALGIARRY